MNRPKQPPIGTCGQFIRTTDINGDPENILTACLITGHNEGSSGLVVTFTDQQTGRRIEGAQISVFDLVSDEDVATHDISTFE